MKFDKTKLIEKPKTLPDGFYYYEDELADLIHEVVGSINTSVYISNNRLAKPNPSVHNKVEDWTYFYKTSEVKK